jgi:hypothetical protein
VRKNYYLPSLGALCYSTPPDEKSALNQVVARLSSGVALTATSWKRFDKGVDENGETLHNLTSLLQRTQRFEMHSQQYRIKFFKN